MSSPPPDSFIDKLLCCKRGGKHKTTTDEPSTGANRTSQPEWTVSRPLDGIPLDDMNHKRITVQESVRSEVDIEDPVVIDPNVIEEVSDADLEKESTKYSRAGMTLPPIQDSPDHSDTISPLSPISPKSIEDVQFEYDKAKAAILEDIRKEEEGTENREDFLVIPSDSEKEQRKESVKKNQLKSDKSIDEEIKQVIESIEDELDEEERGHKERPEISDTEDHGQGTSEDQKKEQEEAKGKNVPVVEPLMIHTGNEHSEVTITNDSELPRESDPWKDSYVKRNSESIHDLSNVSSTHDHSHDPFTSDLDSDSDEILIDDHEQKSPATSFAPPRSVSSGIATSTMYSAASDDSDISDGEELPENKQVFSSKENGTRLSVKSNGAATIISDGRHGEVRVAVGDITDEEFPEKLV